MRIAREFPVSYQRLFWVLPLLPLIFVTDLTALLWLGGTGLILLLVKGAHREREKHYFAEIRRLMAQAKAAGLLEGK